MSDFPTLSGAKARRGEGARGRRRRPWARCSRAWATQPAARPMEKVERAEPGGRPRAAQRLTRDVGRSFARNSFRRLVWKKLQRSFAMMTALAFLVVLVGPEASAQWAKASPKGAQVKIVGTGTRARPRASRRTGRGGANAGGARGAVPVTRPSQARQERASRENRAAFLHGVPSRSWPPFSRDKAARVSPPQAGRANQHSPVWLWRILARCDDSRQPPRQSQLRGLA